LASPGGKQPFHFRLLDERPFAFAGLWELWDRGGDPVESCAILTTSANAVVRPVHDRMPVILRPEDFAAWLDPLGSPAGLRALLRPYPAEEMEARAVGRWVNNPRHEGADCLAPAG
jgi:putative SOS response-associated peptidase YedK